MKAIVRYFLPVLFFSPLFFASCMDQQSEKKVNALNRDSVKLTSIQWIDSVKNFGKISDGEVIEVAFRYKNTGSNPLVFFDVKAGCGCTIVSKPEDPVMPGQEGIIKGRFDSRDKAGVVHKYISAVCNTERSNYTLMFEGEVLSKDKATVGNGDNSFPQKPKSF